MIYYFINMKILLLCLFFKFLLIRARERSYEQPIQCVHGKGKYLGLPKVDNFVAHDCPAHSAFCVLTIIRKYF